MTLQHVIIVDCLNILKKNIWIVGSWCAQYIYIITIISYLTYRGIRAHQTNNDLVKVDNPTNPFTNADGQVSWDEVTSYMFVHASDQDDVGHSDNKEDQAAKEKFVAPTNLHHRFNDPSARYHRSPVVRILFLAAECKFCKNGKVPNEPKTSCEIPPWKTPLDCPFDTEYLNDTDANKRNWACNPCPDGANCQGFGCQCRWSGIMG